jgi:TolB-like protein/DNA-binding winged helix-turn-helix (wHTH) protein
VNNFRVGTWLVQPGLNTISQNGTSRQLEPKVMEVLVCLAHHHGETLPKEQLLKTVWPDTFVSDDVLVRSISEIRRAFEDDARESKFIQTISKRGYRLIAAVERVNGTALATVADSVPVATAAESVFKRRSLRNGILIGITATVALLTLFALMPAHKWRRFAGKSGVPQIRSIAVLPLQNLSGDPAQEYFADAMTEELITELSRLSSLRVISRTSVMRYKKTDKSLPEIARELGVDGIVEGSVVRSGDRVRVTAQLIYAPRDTNLWAQTYDRDLRDVLTLQSSVASAIADEIHAKMTPEAQEHLKSLRPVNRKALDAYLDGHQHLERSSDLALRKTGWPKPSEAEFRKAVTYFEQATREDPDYSPAYLGLSQAWEAYWLPALADLEKAKAAAVKAVELDSESAQAHLQLAHMLILYDRDWTAAEKEFVRVLEIAPSSAAGHDDYAGYLENLGRREQAQREYEWAQQLDPSEVHVPDFSQTPNQKVEEGRRYMATHTVTPIDNWLLAQALYQAGMHKEAVDNWTLVMDTYGWTEEAERVRRAYSTADPKRAAMQMSQEVEEISKYHWLQPSCMIEFYFALDDQEHILAWVEKGVAEHEWDTVFSLGDKSQGDKVYGNLRSNPRFQELVRRAGLPP